MATPAKGQKLKAALLKSRRILSPLFSASEKKKSEDPVKSSSNADYNLIVIGGGSGGLACAKEAGGLGKKVLVLDYVEPSLKGTKWGLGGTCVNVGCIPKKLMHQTALLGQSLRDAKAFGWEVQLPIQHNWEIMAKAVQDYVRSLNWGHRVQLQDKGVEYVNAKGSLLNGRTVEVISRKKEKVTYTADYIVLATGMRPKYPQHFEGAREHCITSEDIFWRTVPPGRTLVIGGSYVALECAGFLAGLGYPVTVMVRSIPLRGFDQDMADMVVKGMHHHGTQFLFKCTPTKVTKAQPNSDVLTVTWTDKEGKKAEKQFDTVLLAAGRSPATRELGLPNANIHTDDDGYVIGNSSGDREQTSCPNVYAIGDILKGAKELTPVAIRAGKLLARRLFSDSKEQMDYEKVATTVFTPIEYACVGLSEAQAVESHGRHKIEIYHAYYKPLEFTIPQRNSDQCYVKMVTERQKGTVLGIHITGPNAGEIMQGFAAAFRFSPTVSQLTSTVGIHPTVAEEIVKLHITKRSGLDPHVTGC